MINSLEPVAQEHALLKRVEDAVFLLVGAQGSYPDGEAAEERAFMQLPVLFVMSDLCVCGNGLAVSARRMTMLLGEWRHDARVLSAPPCHGMIVVVACLFIPFRTFVSPSLRHSSPLRATPLLVWIVAR